MQLKKSSQNPCRCRHNRVHLQAAAWRKGQPARRDHQDRQGTDDLRHKRQGPGRVGRLENAVWIRIWSLAVFLFFEKVLEYSGKTV
jgi:hypothetical protein